MKPLHSIPTAVFIALAYATRLITAAPAATAQDTQVAGTVTQEQAARHLRAYVAPVYPAIAATAKVTGIVIVAVEIAADGRARSIGIVSGSPLLNDAAIEAVNGWRYDPFLLDGAPVAVRSTARVPFQLLQPNTTVDPDIWVLPFFDEGARCDEAMKTRVFAEVERRCLTLVPLAEKLPTKRVAERVAALRASASALAMLGRPKDALPLLERAAGLAEKGLAKSDPAIGEAWFQFAKAVDAQGDFLKADEAYMRAEKAIRETPTKASLREVLTSYLEFLTRTGQVPAAIKARDRLNALPERRM